MALPAAATRKASRTCVLDGLQPAVLTISGPGVQANRGKPQAVADRMLIIHGYLFDAAWSCGMDALNSLEQQTLRTTLEYDEAEHSLQGPLLEQVLQAAGVDVGQAMARGLQLTLQGIDGYRSQMPRSPPSWTACRWPWAAWARSGPFLQPIRFRSSASCPSSNALPPPSGGSTTCSWAARLPRPPQPRG